MNRNQNAPYSKRLPYEGVGASEEHAKLLCDSYFKWTGKSLLQTGSLEQVSIKERLFYAPIVLLSHGVELDPILNYGNQQALELWGMDWLQFTKTPSRYTAESMERKEREAFLYRVNEYGYVDDYTGIRISSTGKRFWIEQAVVWNLVDGTVQYCGQAAAFSSYRFIESK